MEELQCAVADLHVLANDVSPDRKNRLEIAYGGSTSSYMIGCYIGHSKPVELGGNRVLTRRTTYFVHCASWPAATPILRQGLKSMGRQDIHMVPLHMNMRQEAYIRPDARKTNLWVIDGAIASASCITFRKLENDVIASRCLGGAILPCCITSIWIKNHPGRSA